MKIRCPQCSRLSSVAAEQIPYRGVKARCPHCEAKIFIGRQFQVKLIEAPDPKAREINRSDGPGVTESPLEKLARQSASGPGSPSAAATGPTGSRPSPGRSSRERRPEEDIDWEPPVVIYENRVDGHWRKIVIVATVLIVLGGGIGFWAYERQPVEVEPLARYSKTFESDIERIKSRLAQRFNLSVGHQLYIVSAGSPEIRLIEELYRKCRPTGCTPIETATILPAGRDGFEAEIKCRGGEQHKLRYHWILNTVALDGAICQ